MIKEHFQAVLREYLQEKRNSSKNNLLARVVRNELVEALTQAAAIPREYLVKGSVGQAEWAEVPWISLYGREITETAQKGSCQ